MGSKDKSKSLRKLVDGYYKYKTGENEVVVIEIYHDHSYNIVVYNENDHGNRRIIESGTDVSVLENIM